MTSDKLKCALYGYEVRERLEGLRRKLDMGMDPTFYLDNAYDRIIKLENFCDVNLENSRNAMYTIKDYISKKQYPYAGDVLARIMGDIRDESILRQLKK